MYIYRDVCVCDYMSQLMPVFLGKNNTLSPKESPCHSGIQNGACLGPRAYIYVGCPVHYQCCHGWPKVNKLNGFIINMANATAQLHDVPIFLHDSPMNWKYFWGISAWQMDCLVSGPPRCVHCSASLRAGWPPGKPGNWCNLDFCSVSGAGKIDVAKPWKPFGYGSTIELFTLGKHPCSYPWD